MLSDLAIKLREKEAEIMMMKNSSELSRQYTAKCELLDKKILELEHKRLQLVKTSLEKVIINDVCNIISKQHAVNTKQLLISRICLDHAIKQLLQMKYRISSEEYINTQLTEYSSVLQKTGEELIENVEGVTDDIYKLQEKVDRVYLNEQKNFHAINNYQISTLTEYTMLCDLLDNNNSDNDSFSTETFLSLCNKHNLDIQQLLTQMSTNIGTTTASLTTTLSKQENDLLNNDFKVLSSALKQYHQLISQQYGDLSALITSSTKQNIAQIDEIKKKTCAYLNIIGDNIVDYNAQNKQNLDALCAQNDEKYQELSQMSVKFHNSTHATYLFQQQADFQQQAHLHNTCAQHNDKVVEHIINQLSAEDKRISAHHQSIQENLLTSHNINANTVQTIYNTQESARKETNSQLKQISSTLTGYNSAIAKNIADIKQHNDEYYSQCTNFMNTEYIPLKNQIHQYSHSIYDNNTKSLGDYHNTIQSQYAHYLAQQQQFSTIEKAYNDEIIEKIETFQNKIISNMATQQNQLLTNITTMMNTFITTQQEEIKSQTNQFMADLHQMKNVQTQHYQNLVQYHRDTIIPTHITYHSNQMAANQAHIAQIDQYHTQQTALFQKDSKYLDTYHQVNNLTMLPTISATNKTSYSQLSQEHTVFHSHLENNVQQHLDSIKSHASELSSQYQHNAAKQSQFYDIHSTQYLPAINLSISAHSNDLNTQLAANIAEIKKNTDQLQLYQKNAEEHHNTTESMLNAYNTAINTNIKSTSGQLEEQSNDLLHKTDTFTRSFNSSCVSNVAKITANCDALQASITTKLQPTTENATIEHITAVDAARAKLVANTAENTTLIARQYGELFPSHHAALTATIASTFNDQMETVSAHCQAQMAKNQQINAQIQQLTTNLNALTLREVKQYAPTGQTPMKRMYNYTTQLPKIQARQAIIEQYKNVVPEPSIEYDEDIMNITTSFNLDTVDCEHNELKDDDSQLDEAIVIEHTPQPIPVIEYDEETTAAVPSDTITITTKKAQIGYQNILSSTIQQQQQLFNDIVPGVMFVASSTPTTADSTDEASIPYPDEQQTLEYNKLLSMGHVNAQRMTVLAEHTDGSLYLDNLATSMVISKYNCIQSNLGSNINEMYSAEINKNIAPITDKVTFAETSEYDLRQKHNAQYQRHIDQQLSQILPHSTTSTPSQTASLETNTLLSYNTPQLSFDSNGNGDDSDACDRTDHFEEISAFSNSFSHAHSVAYDDVIDDKEADSVIADEKQADNVEISFVSPQTPSHQRQFDETVYYESSGPDLPTPNAVQSVSSQQQSQSQPSTARTPLSSTARTPLPQQPQYARLVPANRPNNTQLQPRPVSLARQPSAATSTPTPASRSMVSAINQPQQPRMMNNAPQLPRLIKTSPNQDNMAPLAQHAKPVSTGQMPPTAPRRVGIGALPASTTPRNATPSSTTVIPRAGGIPPRK